MSAAEWHSSGVTRCVDTSNGETTDAVACTVSDESDAAEGIAPADYPLLSDGDVLLAVSSHTSLSAITYFEAVVDAPADQHLEAVGGLAPNLRELRLTRSCITNTRCLGTQLANLSVLWLGRCHVADLGGLGALPALRELYAPFNEINDLSPLAQCELMDVLDLEGNRIGALADEDDSSSRERRDAAVNDSDNGSDARHENSEESTNLQTPRENGETCTTTGKAHSERDAERLQACIDACGLSFLHFCNGLTSLNLSNNPISDCRNGSGRRRYRRAVVELVESLEVLDDENVSHAERAEDASGDESTTGVPGAAGVAANDREGEDKEDRRKAVSISGDFCTSALDDMASMRDELALISDGIKYAQVGMDQVYTSTSTSFPVQTALPAPVLTAHAHEPLSSSSVIRMQRPSSAKLDRPCRPSSAMPSPPPTSSRRQRPSTAYMRRPSTATSRPHKSRGPGGDMGTSAEPVGLYWRKNQISSTLIDFATGATNASSGDSAADNDTSDLTRGADAEAICGNPVRGLRARKAESTGGNLGSTSEQDKATAGNQRETVRKLDLLEELRQWKIQTAEKLSSFDSSDDDVDDNDCEQILGLSDADIDALAITFGERVTHDTSDGLLLHAGHDRANILRIPSDGELVMSTREPRFDDHSFTTSSPLTDINSNNADATLLAPSFAEDDGMSHKNLPVGRLRPKMREKMTKTTGISALASGGVAPSTLTNKAW